MATISAPAGDTSDILTAPRQFDLGNHADGHGLWICNCDPTAVLTIEWSGGNAGIGRVNLSGKGDNIVIPAGDITIVTAYASNYPAGYGWLYLEPSMRAASGLTRT